MSTKLALVAAALAALLAGPALAGERPAHHRIHPRAASPVVARSMPAPGLGQYPAPAALAAQSALPACGFAAVESWGQNGFQYCDARNQLPAHDFQMDGRP